MRSTGTVRITLNAVMAAMLTWSLSVVAAAAQNRGPAEIMLFREPAFAGAYQRVSGEVTNLSNLRLNDRVSSFRIVAGAWEVCEHADFGGDCQVFDEDQPDLGPIGWGDRISSLRPVQREPERRRRAAVAAFEHAYFGGETRAFDRPVPDLSRFGWSGRISSLKVIEGRWEACDEPDFHGRCTVFDSDQENLRFIGFNDSIASLRPVLLEPPSPPVMPPPGRSGIVLFERVGFRGAEVTLDESTPSLRVLAFNDRARSVRILGGAWQVCEDAFFNGTCRLLTRDSADLGELGLAARISSLRPADPWPTGQGEPSIQLFEHIGFEGDIRTVDGRVADLARVDFGGVASSVRVAAGVWELCTEPHFGGTCKIVSRDLPDLREAGLNDRVWSVRPVR